MSLKLEGLCLLTRSAHVLGHFFSSLFECEVHQQDVGTYFVVLSETKIFFRESEISNKDKDAFVRLSVDSVDALEDYLKKYQFYCYREGFNHDQSIEFSADGGVLLLIDPDGRHWQVECRLEARTWQQEKRMNVRTSSLS